MKRLVVVVLLCGAVSASADVSPDVRKYLGSAAALFEKLEYEKALAQLKRAKAKSQGPEDDARIALYEGIVLAEMGDATASSAFTTALGMDSNVSLPMVVSPKVQRVFDKAKASVQKLLEAQAQADRVKQEEARKAEEAKKPPPPALVEPAQPEPVVVKPEPAPQGGGVRKLAWIPAAGGVVLAATGAIFLAQAKGAHDALEQHAPLTQGAATQVAQGGKTYQTVGWVLVGTSVAAVAAAGAMFALGGGSSASASAMVTPDGATVALTVALP